MSGIKVLPPQIVRQIAAGEVIESPASVVKELLDNAIDAGATSVTIRLRDGGKTFISVQDNGKGIAKEDLSLALTNHATSKLDDLDLYNISTMGFRGEALFSIVCVSRLYLKSLAPNMATAYEIQAAHGESLGEAKPCKMDKVGTLIEVRDLFFNLPARLKFLKSDVAEVRAVYKVVDSIAMAHPLVGFKVFHNGRLILDYSAPELGQSTAGEEQTADLSSMPPYASCFMPVASELNVLQRRLNQVWGQGYNQNALKVYEVSSDFVLYGYVGLPSYSFTNSSKQMIFVNQRLVNNRQLYALFKVAYAKVIEKARFPTGVLFINIRPQLVDVNVSPAKTEVKLANLDYVKDFFISTLRKVVSSPANQGIASQVAEGFLSYAAKEGGAPMSQELTLLSQGFKPASPTPQAGDLLSNLARGEVLTLNESVEMVPQGQRVVDSDPHVGAAVSESGCSWESGKYTNPNLNSELGFSAPPLVREGLLAGLSYRHPKPPPETCAEPPTAGLVRRVQPPGAAEGSFQLSPASIAAAPTYRLGLAKAQLNLNWIIAESSAGLIIVDQHAAHERIITQELERTYVQAGRVATQSLLIPEIVEGLSPSDVELISGYITNLQKLGLVIDIFGHDAIIVREYPSILEGKLNMKGLIRDIVSDLREIGTPEAFSAKLRTVIATMACHSSRRSGDRLSINEMNSLLRKIEQTENSAACPHGRPTYVVVSWHSVEKLFNRS